MYHVFYDAVFRRTGTSMEVCGNFFQNIILNLGVILKLRDVEVVSFLILENYREKYFFKLTEKIRFMSLFMVIYIDRLTFQISSKP